MFGRRSTASEPAPEADKAPGKGRPTPTRKEAEAARKARLTAPRNRKEEAALRRTRVREARAQTRSAMSSGDDKFLPARDQGPVKRYVRDYIDSRRTVGEFLMPAFFVILVVLLIANPLAVVVAWSWYLLIGLMAVDSVRLIRGAKAGVTERFGADQTKGLNIYIIGRALQMRRLRLPKPLVKAGDTI